MIVFELICRDHHRFEGWFASGEDFAAQKDHGLLECPICGGSHVEKLPTAKIRKQAEAEVAAPVGANTPEPKEKAPIDASKLIDYILTHSENVGEHFAAEARRIHYEEAPKRSIRGTATRAETDDLREEGVPVFSLPIPPQDKWN